MARAVLGECKLRWHSGQVYTKKQVRGAAKFVADERRAGKEKPRSGEDHLVVVRLSKIEMRSIVFLDKPLWQQSAFHLVVGRKGVGKGTMQTDVAARVTRGELGHKRNVIWIASEDSAAIDIKPRLVAAGGDPERVFVSWTGSSSLATSRSSAS